jgi:Cu(I)/Ag(I) efflux system membrane fusion protein
VNRRIVAIVVALSIVCGVAALVAAASRHARPAAATRYVCPMHASVVSDRPGTCPLCNMALVLETPSEAAAPTASVMLGDAQRTRANVATVPAAVRDLVSEAVVPGQVVWDERRLTRVAARVAGRIERVYGGPTGTRIEAGQPLFDVDSPDLVVAQKEFLLALDGAHDTMMDGLREAARQRLRRFGLAEERIDELARTRRIDALTAVRAPSSGVLLDRLATAGQYVNEGTPLFSLAPDDSVQVEAGVFETDLWRVTLGALVSIAAEAAPGGAISGRVASIDRTVNLDTRTVRVRIELERGGRALRPGMFVKVTLAQRAARVLAVPEDAVVATGDSAVAWIDAGSGEFQPRHVRTGRRGGGYVEIISGLSAGDSVAASGGFLIESESQLRAAHGSVH